MINTDDIRILIEYVPHLLSKSRFDFHLKKGAHNLPQFGSIQANRKILDNFVLEQLIDPFLDGNA